MKRNFSFAVLGLFLIGFSFVLASCGEDSSPQNNISEITKIYYKGGGGGVEGSISAGQREEPYKMDGIHNDLCDFSLVVVQFDEQFEENEIEVNLSINGNLQTLTMYFNPLSNSYMADLGYLIGSNDQINLSYNTYSLDFFNVSDSFSVSYSEAVDIALDNLDMQEYYQDGVFKGECYLKILSEKDSDLEDLLWIFSVVGENGNVKNIVINVENGEVLS